MHTTYMSGAISYRRHHPQCLDRKTPVLRGRPFPSYQPVRTCVRYVGGQHRPGASGYGGHGGWKLLRLSPDSLYLRRGQVSVPTYGYVTRTDPFPFSARRVGFFHCRQGPIILTSERIQHRVDPYREHHSWPSCLE